VAQVEAAEAELVDALRARQESAFASLVQEHHPSILRVARLYVSSPATAEEVAQETWLAVLNGIDRFEGRSTLKTWIFRILTNIARTRGQRDARSVPFSSLGEDANESAVDPDRFAPAGERWAGPGSHTRTAGTPCPRSGWSVLRRVRVCSAPSTGSRRRGGR
jgi:RNA polymerase sigma-70 factor, ECF subfamily